jgi:hypothetical protein
MASGHVNRANGPNTWVHRLAMHAPGTYALIREAGILPGPLRQV